jgi:acetyl/propionyl-CoA carboxylase alpha subunit
VTLFRPPGGPGVRNDEGVASGDTIGPDYDPLLAKLSVWAPDRDRALERLRRALAEYVVAGLTTNLEFLGQLARMPEVQSGQYDIGLVERRADELTALGTIEPSRLGATVAAAAVASLHVGTNTTQLEQSDDALSPWVLAERLGRSGRFER